MFATMRASVARRMPIRSRDVAPLELLECVVNVSEGRDQALLKTLADAAEGSLLGVHHDADHHRSVFTLGGAPAPLRAAVRRLAGLAVERVDLSHHTGIHPRIGVLDVVPFVALERDGSQAPLRNGRLDTAIAARDDFARWAGATLGLPCFLYGELPDGEERSLPALRRQAWRQLRPDTGPNHPHPTAGASAVGARGLLVAYNVWLAGLDPAATLAAAKAIAGELRKPGLRTLGLAVTGGAQVSCNLVEPDRIGPAEVFDAVVERAAPRGVTVTRAELVGLVPRRVLDAIPPARWAELDLGPPVTIEARLEQAGLNGGRFPA